MSAEILQAIATALVTILGCFMFYDSKKRTEAAKAWQEEAKATAQYASGWKDLCERKDSELKAKDEKIDSLYDALNQHRASEDKLKDENMELRLQLQEASWNRCIRNGCERRSPPRKREQEEKNALLPNTLRHQNTSPCICSSLPEERQKYASSVCDLPRIPHRNKALRNRSGSMCFERKAKGKGWRKRLPFPNG